MTTLDVLQQARALISDPARWTQREYARNRYGLRTLIGSEVACTWCAAGATSRVARNEVLNEKALEALAHDLHYPDLPSVDDESLVVDFNDDHSHAEVLALFDAAIARLESAVTP